MTDAFDVIPADVFDVMQPSDDWPVREENYDGQVVWFVTGNFRVVGIRWSVLNKILARGDANRCVLCGRYDCWPELHTEGPGYEKAKAP